MSGPKHLAAERLNNEKNRPLLTVDSALDMLVDCQTVATDNPKLAEAGLDHVRDFFRKLVTDDRLHAVFRNYGVNLTTATAICHDVVIRLNKLAEQCQIGFGNRQAAWDAPVGSAHAAREYLLILNGEKSGNMSKLVADVTETADVSLKVLLVGTTAIIILPAVVSFVAEAGAVGVAAQAVRFGAQRAFMSVVSLVCLNPVAAYEIIAFTVGTVFSIAMAGGPRNWVRGLATVEGGGGTALDIFVIYIAIRTGAPVPTSPRNRGRRPSVTPPLIPAEPEISAPRVQYKRVQARVVANNGEATEARVTQVDIVDELPPSTPQKLRSVQRLQLDRPRRPPMPAGFHQLPEGFDVGAARAAVRRARALPSSRAYPGSVEATHGGVCECNAVSEALKKEFSTKGGTFPAGTGGDHDVYIFPRDAKMGEPRAYLDGTAAQYTEYVAGTEAGRGKNLVPIARLVQENLDDCVKTGVFTAAQHKRFCDLVVQYLRR